MPEKTARNGRKLRTEVVPVMTWHVNRFVDDEYIDTKGWSSERDANIAAEAELDDLNGDYGWQ